ncbi:toluene tolerance protein Ttg2D [Neisseria sp. oral taxon 020 str. F0370]|uniref:MlaC/ttg2D family ABC transporter substrate-binding protein n=1 Tax=unclassified Neisseria TaxID=2623750 RepID=UPI0002A284AD|nr:MULTISPECIES: ABC transporter substrate-binding protein [unclassified Neisseria]ASP17897.1 toluene tolerance protein [Neisseria sp. KEM232]EKY04520.1 toluene tolerance protein Ttg2D [Neisseria sp. oral taxon 020 str. F0370]
MFAYRYAVCAVLAAAPAVQAAENHPAQQQVRRNIEDVLGIVKNASLDEQQRIRRVEQYADRFLDYERLSAMAVGQPWRQFDARQKQEFVRAFKDMLIRMYARSAMMGARRAEVKVLPKITERGGKTDVYSEIRTPEGKRYEVAYQLYPSGGVYKLYNIQVDGVGIVTVYRNQFGELIAQKGIDGMIETVKNKGLKRAD